MDDLPPDPIIHSIALCPGRKNRPCGRPMKRLAVYCGLGSPEKKNLRGSISQTCSDYNCRWTHHHTAAYNFQDAERLLRRIDFPGDPSGYPRTLRPANNLQAAPQYQERVINNPIPPLFQPPQTAPSQTQPLVPIVQPIPTQSISSGKIDCARPNCFTQSGTRTQGSRYCVENKCKKCCINSAKIAMENGTARKACATHAQPQINATVNQPSTEAQIPSTVTPSAQPTSQANVDTSNQTNSTVSTPVFESHVSISQPSLPSQVTKQISAVSGGVGRRLAQPVGGTWGRKRTDIKEESSNVKTLKVQQHEMDEQRKRTCTLVVYHTDGEQPIRIDQYIPSFPHFRLSASTQLMKDLELDSTSRLDFWTGEWLTISVDSVITVDRGQRLLFKIRPSLRRSLDNCPGIESELKLQLPVNTASRSMKRQGDDSLVSPIRKSVRTREETGIHVDHLSEHQHIMINHQNPLAVSLSTPSSQPYQPKDETVPTITIPKKQTTITKTSGLKLTQDSDSEPKPKDASDVASKPVRWPFDFKVYQIQNGLIQIRETLKRARVPSTRIRQHSSRKGKEKQRPKYTITVETAFHAAFPGAVYKKTTFYEHREMWEKYDPDIIDLFVDLGDSKNATYTNLLKALKNPNHIPDKSIHSDTSDSEVEQGAESGFSKSRSASVSTEIPAKPSALSSNSSVAILTANSPTFSQASNLIRPPNLCRLQEQVRDMKELLEFMICNPEESEFFCRARETYAASSSRNNVRPINQSQDLLHCNSFYGSSGFSIIFGELELMFPKGSLDMELLAPLSRYVVMTEFLIPETVILLVQEELRISTDKVLQVVRDQYINQSNTIPMNEEHTQHRSATSSPLPDPPVKTEPFEHTLPLQGTETQEIIDLTLESDSSDSDIYY